MLSLLGSVHFILENLVKTCIMSFTWFVLLVAKWVKQLQNLPFMETFFLMQANMYVNYALRELVVPVLL